MAVFASALGRVVGMPSGAPWVRPYSPHRGYEVFTYEGMKIMAIA